MTNKDRHTAEYYLHLCPYFTSASFGRAVSQLTEEEFNLGAKDLSPGHIHVIILVNENKGISPSELAKKLNFAPSTITRMIDKLVQKGILERRMEGKSSMTYPTDKSMAMQKDILEAFKRLYTKFTDKLGKKDGYKLIKMLDQATSKLTE